MRAAPLLLLVFGCEDDWDRSENTDLSIAVVQCEEAYARLEKCCPGFMGGQLGENEWWGALCEDFSYEKHNSYGCDGNTDTLKGHIQPALNRAETTCILDTSCETIRETGVCTRAAKATARGEGDYYAPYQSVADPGGLRHRDGGPQPLVCP